MDKQAKQALDKGLERLQDWKLSFGAWNRIPRFQFLMKKLKKFLPSFLKN